MFTSDHRDSELGLVYLRARYYNPQAGRFLRPDPIRGPFRGTQDLNRYVYSVNRPLVYVDRTGLAYFYAKGRVAGFFKVGGALETGVYVDPSSGRTRIIVEPGLGVGIGVRVQGETGVNFTGDLPSADLYMRADLGGSAISELGAKAKLSFLDPKLWASLSAGSLKGEVSTQGDVVVAVIGGLPGAEASGTIGGAIVAWEGDVQDVPAWVLNAILGRERARAFSSHMGRPPSLGKFVLDSSPGAISY